MANYAYKLLFPDGGELPKKKDKVEPYKPLNIDDYNKRQQAYSDSLALYNNHRDVLNELINQGYRETNNKSFDDPGRRNSEYTNAEAAKLEYNKMLKTGQETGVQETPTLRSVIDFKTGVINESLGRQLYSEEIKPKGTSEHVFDMSNIPEEYLDYSIFSGYDKDLLKEYVEKTGDSRIGDIRLVGDYSNVKPKQEILPFEEESEGGRPLEEKKVDRETYYYDGSKGAKLNFKSSLETLTRKRENLDIQRKTTDLSDILSLGEPEIEKEVYYRHTPSQFPNVQIRHYEDGSKTYVNADGQEATYTYGEMPKFDKNYQYKYGGNMKQQYKGGGFLKDLGMFALDAIATPAEILTGKNFYNPAYSGQGFENAGKALTGVQSLATSAAPTALNMVVPGAGTALGAVQGMVGSNVQDNTLDRNQGAVDFGSKAGSVGSMALPFMMANGGDLTQYMNGGTHEENPNGGIPVGQGALVEEGETRNKDFIYSDRLKPKGSKKTFADLSKVIEAKYKGRERDTAANKAKQQALDTLAQEQESLKESQLTKELIGNLKSNAKLMADGGGLPGSNKLPADFWSINTPGLEEDYLNTEMRGPFTVDSRQGLSAAQQQLLDAADFRDNGIPKLPSPSIFPEIAPNMGIDGVPKLPNPSIFPEMSKLQEAQGFASFTPEFTEEGDENSISEEEINSVPGTASPDKQPIMINPMGGADTFFQPGKDQLSELAAQNLKNAPEPAEMFAPGKYPSTPEDINQFLEDQKKYINRGTALASIPDLYNLMQASKGPDDVNLERFTPETIDLSEQRKEARRQSRMAGNVQRENIREVASSGAEALSASIAGDTANAANLSAQLGQSFQTEENLNKQILNQAGMTNTQIGNREYMMREQNKALVDSLLSQSIAGLSQTGQSHFKDLGATMGQDRMNEMIINAINEGVLSDFTLDRTGGLTFKNVDTKKKDKKVK